MRALAECYDLAHGFGLVSRRDAGHRPQANNRQPGRRRIPLRLFFGPPDGITNHPGYRVGVGLRGWLSRGLDDIQQIMALKFVAVAQAQPVTSVARALRIVLGQLFGAANPTATAAFGWEIASSQRLKANVWRHADHLCVAGSVFYRHGIPCRGGVTEWERGRMWRYSQRP